MIGGKYCYQCTFSPPFYRKRFTVTVSMAYTAAMYFSLGSEILDLLLTNCVTCKEAWSHCEPPHPRATYIKLYEKPRAPTQGCNKRPGKLMIKDVLSKVLCIVGAFHFSTSMCLFFRFLVNHASLSQVRKSTFNFWVHYSDSLNSIPCLFWLLFFCLHSNDSGSAAGKKKIPPNKVLMCLPDCVWSLNISLQRCE